MSALAIGRTSNVFTNTVGGHIWAEDLLKRPLLAKAGVRRVRFHDLRHSTATLLLSCRVHPKVVSEIFGRSAILITLDLYTHVSEDLQREAVDRLGELLGSQLGSHEPQKGPEGTDDEQA